MRSAGQATVDPSRTDPDVREASGGGCVKLNLPRPLCPPGPTQIPLHPATAPPHCSILLTRLTCRPTAPLALNYSVLGTTDNSPHTLPVNAENQTGQKEPRRCCHTAPTPHVVDTESHTRVKISSTGNLFTQLPGERLKMQTG